MRPEDDPMWPLYCRIDSCSGPLTPTARGKEWCPHVREALANNDDGDDIVFGDRVCVPVVPSHDLWAEVSISNEEIVPGLLANASVVTNEATLFNDEEVLESIGMWTKGEGRWILAMQVKAWLDGQVSGLEFKCTHRNHGFPNEMAWQQDKKNMLGERMAAHAWCMVVEKRCYHCHFDDLTAGSPRSLDLNGATYGMDQVSPTTNRDGRRSTDNNRQASTRDLLRSRFGGN